MKRTLLALAVTAFATCAFAAVTNQDGFETGGTPYAGASEKPTIGSPYPFEDFGDKYCEIDDEGQQLNVAGADAVDMVVQFVCHPSTPEGVNEGKICIYANADGKLVVDGSEVDTTVTSTTISEDTWYRLTIVKDNLGYKVYLNRQLLANCETAEMPGAFTSVEVSGSGKLDNFVARTTDPFNAPANCVAKIGTTTGNVFEGDYFTDFGEAFDTAFAQRKTYMLPDGTVCGTAEAPFKIATASNLETLANAIDSGYGAGFCYEQVANIDMAGRAAFPGIGTYDATPTNGVPFTGTYDGGNYKIANVTMTKRNYGGVFNQVNGGTIKNLVVENIAVESGATGEYGYAVVGNAGNGALLQNITAAGSFLSETTPGMHNMAGIVVRLSAGGETETRVVSCTNNAAIYGTYTKLAGISAIAQTKIAGSRIVIENCSNTGTLTMPSGANAGQDGLAGILGYASENVVLRNCANSGTMSSTLATARIGQLVGYVNSKVLTLEDAGTITGNVPRFGDFGNATVQVAWNPDNSNARINFNDLGDADSKVEIVGVNGAFIALPSTNWGTSGGSAPTIVPEIVLSANWTIGNGWTADRTTITKLSGTGDLIVNGTTSAGAAIPYTIGTLDGYTGTLAGRRAQYTLGNIVYDGAATGTNCIVKLTATEGKEPALGNATVNGAAAVLKYKTIDDLSGIYMYPVLATVSDGTIYDSVEAALMYVYTKGAAGKDLVVTVNDPSYVHVHDVSIDSYFVWHSDTRTYTVLNSVASIAGTPYETLAAAVAAAKTGNTIIIEDNITLDARVEPNLGAGTELIINLNGKTITRTGTSGNGSVFDVKSGSVTIENGTIDCTQDDTEIVKDGVYAITARSGAQVVLQNLTVTVDSQAGACVYPFAGATATIKSGTYSNLTDVPYQYHSGWTGMALNQANIAQQAVFVEGGTFSKVDPALGDDSWADGQGTFLATGFKTVANGDGSYTVAAKTQYTVKFVDTDGTTELAQTSSVYEGDTAVKPADPEREGFEFAGWTLAGASYDFTAPVNANLVLVASWTEVVPPDDGFDGGEAGKSFTIDTAVQAALEAALPEGASLADPVAGSTSGLTYAQAYALGLFDAQKPAADIKPTIQLKDGNVVVSIDADAKSNYKVMLSVYESATPIAASAETGWTLMKTYQLGAAEEAAAFEPGSTVKGFYKVAITIENAAE